MDRTPYELRAFHFWIQGYPKFYEPIAEEYFVHAGYTVLQRHPCVFRPDVERAISDLFDGRKQLGPELDARKLVTYLQGRNRIVPDLLVARAGQYSLVELKSWGGDGSGIFDMPTLKNDFMRSPQRSVWLLVDSVNGKSIAGKILVVSSRSPQHDQVVATLCSAYNTNIELLYLDEIFKTPQLAGIIDRQCRYLDAAVAELKQALGAWPGGDAP